MDLRLAASSSGHGDSPPTHGGERAPKRRRLNNGRSTRDNQADGSPATASTAGADGRLASEEDHILDTSGNSPDGHEPRFLLTSHSGGIDLLSNLELPINALDTPQREHELVRGLNEADVMEPRTQRSNYASSTRQANYPSAEDHNLPFGVLYSSNLQHAAPADDDFASSRHRGDITEHSMDGMEAIDLTAVNDGSELRVREDLDEQERRLRREASMKIEARRKANAQMLKSTLEQQQTDPANVEDQSGGKGLGNMQCVICMDNFTDMTATHCGHLFCHTCINEHLITAEMSRGYPTTKALCPFCRTPVFRKAIRKTDKEKSIVPLIFKVKSKASQSRGKDKQPQPETLD